MPRKPSISPSKITTYLACPLKYRWTYVDSRGKWYLKSKSYYSFGLTIHQVLQRFHDSGDEGVTTQGEAMAAYDENWIDAGFGSAEEMAEAYGEGKLILEQHFEQNARRPLSSKTLFVEKMFRSDFGAFDLVGRIDRVDEHEDGTLEIIDYKSGKTNDANLSVREDIAMGCYQLLLKEKYPDRPVVATLIALRTSKSDTSSLTDQEALELRHDIAQLGALIVEEDYHELTPKPKILCKHCDFLPLCRKHEEFDELYRSPPFTQAL